MQASNKDPYLWPQASFSRLQEEYKKYGSLVIAFDFDGVVFDYHGTGCSYPEMEQLLRKLRAANCFLVCFTAEEDTQKVRTYLAEHNIPFDTINENPPFFKSDARKIYYNALLDDRAGLIQVFNELTKLLNPES